jgi:hypothetical protein
MNQGFSIDSLAQEIARYLAAVETFRAEGCEPNWRPEPGSSTTPIVLRLAAYDTPASQTAH